MIAGMVVVVVFLLLLLLSLTIKGSLGVRVAQMLLLPLLLLSIYYSLRGFLNHHHHRPLWPLLLFPAPQEQPIPPPSPLTNSYTPQHQRAG